MKWSEAVVLWTPANWPGDRYTTRGEVSVHRRGQAREHWDRYAFKGGAAHAHIHRATGDKALALLFIEFQTLVVRDGIEPRAAHRAFLQIDEYRDACSPDTPGAAP